MRASKRSSVNGLLLACLLLIGLLAVGLYRYRQSRLSPERSASVRKAPEAAGVGGQEAPFPARLELPAVRNGDERIPQRGFTLVYRDDAGQAAWVAYVLTGRQVAAANEPRSNNFRPDQAVAGGTAGDADYEGSGYDRGHLAPAEDLSYSRETMRASFLYSNVSPQLPAFNRGVWRRLEELVRFWATAYDSVFIVTGPVLQEGLRKIGPNHVALPLQFYKVVLRNGADGPRGIGFLLRHEPSSATLRSFVVPIDEVEQATGLDFFPQLPDEIEIRVEKEAAVEQWRWTRK